MKTNLTKVQQFIKIAAPPVAKVKRISRKRLIAYLKEKKFKRVGNVKGFSCYIRPRPHQFGSAIALVKRENCIAGVLFDAKSYDGGYGSFEEAMEYFNTVI